MRNPLLCAGLGAVTTQQPLSWWVGTWQASQWTAGARAGGDPDPTADEAELRVAADGTLNIGTDNLEGHVPAGGASLVYIPTGDKDVVAVSIPQHKATSSVPHIFSGAGDASRTIHSCLVQELQDARVRDLHAPWLANQHT